MRSLLIPLVVLAALVAWTPAFAAELVATHDWPQWRGPLRDGKSTETGLLKEWPAEGPPLAWTAEGLGVGFAGVSMAGNRIYSMGMDPAKDDKEDTEFVIALDRATGKQLWKTPIGSSPENGGYRGPRCTPTLDGELLYALGSQGKLVCLETASGKLRWEKDLTKDFDGKMMSIWGYSESPLIDGDRVLVTPGGAEATIVALNKATGDLIWKSTVPELGAQGKDGAGYASIIVTNGGGVKQYVQLLGRGLVGVRASDGKFLWGYNKVANSTANIPTAAVQDDYIFTSSGYGTGAALLKLSPEGDGVKAEEVYFKPGNVLQNHHGGFVILGDYLYLGDGHNRGFPTCIEWKTGKLMWGKKRGPGERSSCVLYADGRLYYRYENGLMVLVGANPEKYEEFGMFTIPNVERPSWPHPVIADGRLYLREQDKLYCYKLR